MTVKTKTKPQVKLNIKPGKLSPAQIQAGKRFWQRLIASVREELQAESEGKGDR